MSQGHSHTATRHSFYYPELDSLRFFAFLLIFFHHAGISDLPVLKELQAMGWIGIEIFFCLSAYLLTRLLGEEYALNGRIQVRNFFIRRILRIWPLYFAFLAGVLALQLAREPSFLHLHWQRVLGLGTFTDNFFSAVAGYNPLNYSAHLWTISYEEQFYLCIPFAVPLLLKVSRRKRFIVLVAILVIGWAIRILFITNQMGRTAIYVLPFTHFESILAGIALAWGKPPRVASMIICIASVVALVVLQSLSPAMQLMLMYPLGAFFSAALTGSALFLKDPVARRMLTFPVFVYLGKISFGLYVFHLFGIALCAFVFGYRLPGVQAFIALLATVGMAHGSYCLWERRFLKMKGRFTVISNKPV